MQQPSLLSRVWPTAIALLAMLIACIAYFAPQLSGKEVPSGDAISYRGMSKELRTYEETTGEQTLWTNSMFGGMPTYQMAAPERGNLLRFIEDVLFLGFDKPIGYFFVIMLGMFVLLRVLGVNIWLATIGAITFGLGANHMTLFEAGHMTKLRTISTMAPTLAGLIVLFRGNYLGGLALFAVSLGLNLYTNHPQMTYYLAAACGCFVVYRFIEDLGTKQLKRFATALALSLLGAGLAVGAQYSKLSTTIEYSRDTMRGAPILASDPGTPAATSSSEVEGLEWGYAMQWSNGLIDVLASFVPGVAGGSGAVPVESDGPLATAISRGGGRLPANFEAPLYHGELPFTSGPAYFGAVAVFLFILSLFVLSPGWRYFFGAAVLLTLLISMGKHAEWLNRLLFETLPYFNSFRSPSSATSVTAFLVVAGGFAGIHKFLQLARAEEVGLRQNLTKRLALGTGVSAAIVLAILMLTGSMAGFEGAGDARLVQAGFPIDAILAERADYLQSTAVRALVLILAAAGALWLHLRGTLSATPVIVALGVLSVFDVWIVSRDYLASSDFVPARQVSAQFTKRPVDEQILRDTDPHYRVLDLSVNTFNDAKVSYWHKTIGGYHAAKLQRAQDLIDRHISRGNQAVLDMLNTKYIITGQPGSEQVQRNPGALGNAWFVSDVQVVPNANAEIDALSGLEPGRIAIVHEEFADRLPATSYSGEGSISLTSYAPNRLTYNVQTSSPQLAVFSEIWYGPDKGWKVSIDGQPAELIRVNYALRGFPLPAGAKSIEMYFEPDTFYAGETISYVASGLILAIAAFALFVGFRNRSTRGADAQDQPSAPAAETTL